MQPGAVGEASGSFTTRWSDDPNKAHESDQLTLALTLHGEAITLEEAGVVAQPFVMPRFGPPGPAADGPDQAPPATVEIRGHRALDDQPLSLTLVVDRDALAAGKTEPIRVFGSLREGPGQFGFPKQMLTGTLSLTSGGTNKGNEISGAFDTEIVEMRGGMFDGMRGGPR